MVLFREVRSEQHERGEVKLPVRDLLKDDRKLAGGSGGAVASPSDRGQRFRHRCARKGVSLALVQRKPCSAKRGHQRHNVLTKCCQSES